MGRRYKNFIKIYGGLLRSDISIKERKTIKHVCALSSYRMGVNQVNRCEYGLAVKCFIKAIYYDASIGLKLGWGRSFFILLVFAVKVPLIMRKS